MCDRHHGVGADGVEWMLPHASADVEIDLINADGSAAEISGNGTRCVAAYLFSEQQTEKITVQTGAGLKTCMLTSHRDGEYEFEMAMGSARVEAEFSLDTSQWKDLAESRSLRAIRTLSSSWMSFPATGSR